ncbi:MAG: M12 family metallo-peptidase [Syntrophothermus sp.]
MIKSLVISNLGRKVLMCLIFFFQIFSYLNAQERIFEKNSAGFSNSKSVAEKLEKFNTRTTIKKWEEVRQKPFHSLSKNFKGIFNIFDLNLEFKITEDYGIDINGVHGFYAELKDGGNAYLSVTKNGISASVWHKDEYYSIENIENEMYFVSNVNIDELTKYGCGVKVNNNAKLNKNTSPTKTSSINSPSVLRIFIAYTPAVATGYDEEYLINQCQTITNAAFARSNISSSIQIVGSALVNYTESGSDVTDIDRLVNPNDSYMDEIHSLRNEYDADICIVLQSTVGESGGYASAIGATRTKSFAIVRADQVVPVYTFTHELGHLLGCQHENDYGEGPYINAHGYSWNGKLSLYYPTQRNLQTIMGNWDFAKFKRVPYFSNPNIYDELNNAMGSSSKSNCAAAIDDYASTAASLSPFYTTSGIMNINEWWSGAVTINSNLTIPAGVTLTINPGTQVYINNGASLTVNGTLVANGTSSSRIKFDFVNKNSGIKFRYTGSAGSITYADIKNAYSAVDCYEASPTLLNNSFYDSETGLNCQYNSSPTLAGYYLNGNNIITNNVRGINTSYNSNPFVGGTYGGYNSIYGNSLYNISAYYGCSIYAMNNWWGNAEPEASKILQYQSTIDYFHALPADPNLGRPLSKVSFAGSTGNSGQEDELITSLYLQMQEKYDEAIASYGKLISKDLKSSKSTYALSKLSECYEKTGRKDFIDFLNKSIRTKSTKDDDVSITALELENFWLMKQGRYTEAVKTIGKIKSDYIEKKDTYKYALFNEGYIYFVFLNDVAKAKESFTELEEKYPDDALTAESKILMGGTSGGGYSAPKNIASDDSDNKIPETYALLGNYPNPFNPTTTIRYAIPKQSLVEVKIFNIMGNEIKSFTMNSQSAGYYNLLWDGKNTNNEQVSSGTYIYRLRAVPYEGGEVFEKSTKMLLVK